MCLPQALEAFAETTNAPRPGVDLGAPDPIPHSLRKSIAVYEAAKVRVHSFCVSHLVG